MNSAALAISGLIIVGGLSMQADAASLDAVRPLPGYVCMALNIPAAELMNPEVHVTMLKSPDPSSPPVGYAAATVIAAQGPPVNGFRRVLRFDGVEGWIPSAKLRAWVNPGGNGQRCTPSLMSNGRLGLDFK